MVIARSKRREEDKKVVVRRAGSYASEDVHRTLFPKRAPRARSVEQMKAGVRAYMKKRHARG